ncbi:MAG: hypothetical protein AB7F99_17710, partial [Vicinamibacterales bacterium]
MRRLLLSALLITAGCAPAPAGVTAPVRYEAPTARDQRTYCEHERQDAPCQLGIWVSCPPECDLYERLV